MRHWICSSTEMLGANAIRVLTNNVTTLLVQVNQEMVILLSYRQQKQYVNIMLPIHFLMWLEKVAWVS